MTGGGSGLGRATVERFVRDGAKVVLCDIDATMGKQVADTMPNGCTYVQGDVTSEKDVRNALDVAKSKYGGLDVAVNCAGITLSSKMYNQSSKKIHNLDDFTRVVTVSVIGCIANVV